MNDIIFCPQSINYIIRNAQWYFLHLFSNIAPLPPPPPPTTSSMDSPNLNSPLCKLDSTLIGPLRDREGVGKVVVN